MTVSVSVAVMAHPSRAEMVEDLLARLDAPATVVWDEIQDRHDTGVRSLEAFDPNCSHHMVIQDDALSCRDLVAGATEALKWVPAGHPLSAYVGRVKPFAREVSAIVGKADAGVSWIRMAGIYWGPCIVVPTEGLLELCEWFRGAASIQNYDRRTSRWFEARGRECWYTWPSLVDHRGDESLTLGHNQRRNAHQFIGEDVSATEVDWSGEVLSLRHAAQLDQRRQRDAAKAQRRRQLA